MTFNLIELSTGLTELVTLMTFNPLYWIIFKLTELSARWLLTELNPLLDDF